MHATLESIEVETASGLSRDPKTRQSPIPPIRWWKSPTIVSSQFAGFLLLISLWLPAAEGCKGAVIRPIDMASLDSSLDWSQWLVSLSVPIAFSNGIWVANLLVLSAIFCSKRVWQVGFFAQLTFLEHVKYEVVAPVVASRAGIVVVPMLVVHWNLHLRRIAVVHAV